MIENKSEQTFLPDPIREHFGFELVTHSLPTVFFFFLCQYYVYNDYISGANGLTFPGRSYCFLSPIPIPNPIPRQHLSLHVVIFGVMLTPGFFPFFSIASCVDCNIATEQRTVSCPLRLVSRHHCAELGFVLLSRALKGISQVSIVVVLTRMKAPGSSQFCAFSCKYCKCLNPICIYHSPRSAWTLCWSCVLVGSQVVYSSVIHYSPSTPVQIWELLKTGVSNNITFLYQKHHKTHENSCAKIQIQLPKDNLEKIGSEHSKVQ